MDAARKQLLPGEDVLFVRRFVTRPPGAVGEDYQSLTPDEFARQLAAGAFALHWRAHGLSYALPQEIETRLAAGKPVVANVSRSVIDEARRKYGNVQVALVTARPETLRQRLVARGRETADEIVERLERAAAFSVAGPNVITISNDGALGEAAAALLAVIRG